MAARSQPAAAFHRRRLAVGVVVLVALGLPAGAHAHGTTSVDALDFEARPATVASTRDIEAKVIDGDRKLELRVTGSHSVVVLGYEGEPFLRFSATGVEVNERSPTAVILKLANRGSDPALSASAQATWSKLSDAHRYAWHDHRLGPKPGTRYADGDVGGWAVPIVVDGRPDRVAGRLWHAGGPPVWPWLTLLGATLGIAFVVARQRNRRVVEAATVGAAVVACAAALLVSIALGFAPGKPVSAAWGNTVFSGIVAVLALALLVAAPRARQAVAGVVALFAALAGLSHASVLVHGYVIALLPAAIVRAATATSVCAGAVAVVSSLVVFFGVESGSAVSRGPKGTAPRAMAVPRGRARSR